jgi:hypothetical protein
MPKIVLNLYKGFGRDNLAKFIAYTWQDYNEQRRPTLDRWKELRNYVFATDTTTTTNRTLPWKNSTTLPKLCQIRDNLHSNYYSALFPNDDWLRWEGYSLKDNTKDKATTITAYMANKTRISNFRQEVRKTLYDYIDYGNCFATVDYFNDSVTDPSGAVNTSYTGPVMRRISPYDIVFNPLADSFQNSWKIVRSLRPISDLHSLVKKDPDNAYLQKALLNRKKIIDHCGRWGWEEQAKDEGFMLDGFGNYHEYLKSGYVEFLEFYGDAYDEDTGELHENFKITVIDRMWVVQKQALNNWLGHAPIYHAGWRYRPDNLWSMGPLENLVGMQYRIDHLENAKADAYDLAVHPPLLIKGEVEAFTWGPGAEVHLDENGEVTELARNVQWVIQADASIDRLEMRMEQYAGAPKEAMGIRTAGEKTAFEVQQLQNAAGRIFQEKITNFEVDFLEKLLNAMLETAKRNMDRNDVVKVLDNDLGVEIFSAITKEDITASGILRPVGARHFAAQATMIQNLTQISNTPIWQQIAPHISTKQLSKIVEDNLNLNRHELMTPFVAIFEQQEQARLSNQAGEDLEVEQSMPVE